MTPKKENLSTVKLVDNGRQYTVTLPKYFVERSGWAKGDVLQVELTTNNQGSWGMKLSKITPGSDK